MSTETVYCPAMSRVISGKDLRRISMIPKFFFSFFILLSLLVFSCSKNSVTGNDPLPPTGDYVVFTWNDLGMHCLNPTYDTAVILPPYNTVWAQVVKRGNPPAIVTSGLTAEFRIINNTYSYGKRSYGQFWDNAKALFGADLAKNTGLNLVDPLIHNSLSGLMANKSDHFEVDGIPLTPVDDSGLWNPYQNAEITIKDSNGVVVAKTQTTAPTSDEINCQKCHLNDPFTDILLKHDTLHGTNLINAKPVLCASCHASPALGVTSTPNKFLSEVIHKSHSTRNAACYDCHPGQQTSCNRSIAHTAADGNCTACHGDMANVASTVTSGTRVPWVNEPKCVTCHTGVAGVDTGQNLYRHGTGHGGIYCTACHKSPHSMVPSTLTLDNYQAIQYQNKAKSIGSCGVCHSGSRGGGGNEFGEQHGGANPETQTACNICHTSVSATTANWPHAYQWKNR
jgi:hypothetical protein